MASYEDQIKQQYQQSLGRMPTAEELASDLENANKYGTGGSLLSDIAARGSNTPNVATADRQVAYPSDANKQRQQTINYGPPPQPAIDPQTKQRSDGLWQLLYQRATQGTNVDANDPTIKAQTDAYRAEQTRAERNYLSDLAERSSQYANLQGEQRMAAEHLGQNVAGFQAELMSRELTAKRAEITQALQQLGGQLSDEEKLALEQALGAIDAQLKSRGLDIQASGQNQSYDANLRRLGLDEWDRNNYWDYARTFGG